VFTPEHSSHGAFTMTATASGLTSAHGIAGTEAYMAPEMLKVLRQQQKGHRELLQNITETQLVSNDSFGCGCAIAYLCSGGIHPFASAVYPSVAENILAWRRLNLKELRIVDDKHEELVDHLTQTDASKRWTVGDALLKSKIFNAEFGHASTRMNGAEILLDELALRKKPSGSCRDQLLAISEVFVITLSLFSCRP